MIKNVKFNEEGFCTRAKECGHIVCQHHPDGEGIVERVHLHLNEDETMDCKSGKPRGENDE